MGYINKKVLPKLTG